MRSQDLAGVGLCVSTLAERTKRNMKKCKSCQSEIDDKAKKCPKCQSDQRNWFMRHKILTAFGGIIGFFILVGVISASGNKGSKTSEAESNAKNISYGLNQDVPSGDVTWKITSVKDRGTSLLAKDSRYPTISKTKTTAGKFVEITMILENKGKDLASITTPTIIDGQNREFTSSNDVSEWVPEGKDLFLLSNLQPNLPKEFVVIYEVPPGATGLKAKVGVLKPQMIDLGL